MPAGDRDRVRVEAVVDLVVRLVPIVVVPAGRVPSGKQAIWATVLVNSLWRAPMPVAPLLVITRRMSMVLPSGTMVSRAVPREVPGSTR